MSVSIAVHAPPPAGRRSKAAEATPEPESAESEETATEARSAAPSAGAVREPLGAVVSNVNVRLADASAFPAASAAWTRTV